jgi:hypothetical protein
VVLRTRCGAANRVSRVATYTLGEGEAGDARVLLDWALHRMKRENSPKQNGGAPMTHDRDVECLCEVAGDLVSGRIA